MIIQENTIIHGDSLTVLRQMEPESVDAIITDPPYGINYVSQTGASIKNDKSPFIWFLYAAIEEECYVSILLSLCSVELLLALCAQVLTEGIHYVLLREEDVNALEACIVWSHAVVLQVLDGVHAFLWHILLSQYDSQFFCTVVAVVEKDHDITFFDRTIYCSVVDRFDKLVGHAFIIRFLHGLNHVGSLFALAFNQQVVGFFHAFPTFVAVHCIETTDDGCDLSGRLCTVGRQLFDKSFTALRVCVATVHEAVDESIVDSIFLGDIAKFEQVVERTVYATVGGH